MAISFSDLGITRDELKLIDQIDRNVQEVYPNMYRSIKLDLAICHAGGCPLRLADMSRGPVSFDLMHDIVGIRDHVDREHGVMSIKFLPRFKKKKL